jgi:hypothetical protein
MEVHMGKEIDALKKVKILKAIKNGQLANNVLTISNE